MIDIDGDATHPRTQIFTAFFCPPFNVIRVPSSCRRYDSTLTCIQYALNRVFKLSQPFCQRYLNGEIMEEEGGNATRGPMLSNGPLGRRSYLVQDWLQHDRSGEVGLNAGFARCVLPCVFLRAVRSKFKGDVQNLELVDFLLAA